MVRLPSCHEAFLASLLLLLLLPEARGDCGRPGAITNADPRQELKDSYPVGTKVTYNCRLGYEPPAGPIPFIQCLPTSEWSAISATCRRRRCPNPNIENGRIVEQSELLFGDQITFACNEGFRIVGHNGARCVVREKRVVWDNEPPHCERIPCPPPPEIPNGRHDDTDNYVYGTAVTYRCNAGFSLIGNKTIVCTYDQRENGMWSGSAPECKVVRCRTPEIPNGGMVTSYRDSYTYGDRILFKCNPGFKPKDDRDDSLCEADSRWHPLPECIEGSTVQPPVGSTTVKPLEETTKTEIGTTEAPESPTGDSGSSISVPVAVGKLSLVLPLSLTLQSHVMQIFH